MKLQEETIGSEILYQGVIVTVKKDTVLLENGKQSIREVIMHHGGVGIIALDEQSNVLMVRQFRYPYHQTVLEIPAGKLEPGEDPLECGKRELMEETGYAAESYTDLGVLYPTPGYVDEVIHLYLATGLKRFEQNLDEGEFLEVERYPLAQLVEWVMEGKLFDAKSQIAILKTARRMEQKKDEVKSNAE